MILGIAQMWLLFSSMLGGIILGGLVQAVFGRFTLAGDYIGSAMGGGLLDGALGTFTAGVARELVGPRPWNNKRLLVIGLAMGAILGVASGLFWMEHWPPFTLD
jgi:uncharacterized membrane protein YoaK (UPF0700 family)